MLTTNNYILVLVLSVKKYLFSYVLWFLEFHFDEMECCLGKRSVVSTFALCWWYVSTYREQDYFIWCCLSKGLRVWAQAQMRSSRSHDQGMVGLTFTHTCLDALFNSRWLFFLEEWQFCPVDKQNKRWAENAERKKLFQRLKWTSYFKISAKKQTLNLESLENKVRVKCWKTTNKES